MLIVSSCGDNYALVANGYGKTVELSALDDKGIGNFAQPVDHQGCLMAFSGMPNLATLQIRAYLEGEIDTTYTNQDLTKALQGQDFSKGIFVVDANGIQFVEGYDCDGEIR